MSYFKALLNYNSLSVGADELTLSGLTADSILYNDPSNQLGSASIISPLEFKAGDLALSYNGTNLKLSGSQLDTIQDISTTSSPSFQALTVSGLSGMTKAVAGTLSNAVSGTDYEPPITAGTSSQYIRGNKTLGTFITDVRTSISAGSGLSYDNTTGVMTNSATAPSYTLPLSITGSVVDLGYNTTNLKLTSSQLNTIQDIATTSSPTFVAPTVTSKILTTSTNVGLGFNVLNALTSGASNTAVGYRALVANTTGATNVAVGRDALAANVNTDSNTAIGYRALYTATGGGANWQGQSTAVGSGALYSNTSGYFNCAVGASALYSNTTAIENVAVGNSALFSNTTGGQNTAMGHLALSAATTGNSNTAVGTRALASHTGSQSNTAVGSYAMWSGNGGGDCCAFGFSAMASNANNYNCAFGSYALGANTTGTSNLAMGYRALSANSTGSANVAIGSDALRYNTASYNMGMGGQALFYNTSGTRNSAVGYGAVLSNTTSSDQTGIGTEALRNATGGSNTAIGTYAGYGVTTGTGNVFIGTSAGQSVTGSTTSKLYIANTNTATPLLLGDFATKDLTINDNLTIAGLTASNLVLTNASKKLISSNAVAVSGTDVTINNDITVTGLTASNLVLTNASKKLISSNAVAVSGTDVTINNDITVTGLTASQLVQTNGSKKLISSNAVSLDSLIVNGGSTIINWETSSQSITGAYDTTPNTLSSTVYYRRNGTTTSKFVDLNFSSTGSFTAAGHTVSFFYASLPFAPFYTMYGTIQVKNNGNWQNGWWYIPAGSSTMSINPNANDHSHYFLGACEIPAFSVSYVST